MESAIFGELEDWDDGDSPKDTAKTTQLPREEKPPAEGKFIPKKKLRRRVVVEPRSDRIDPVDLATNVVDLLDEDVEQFKKNIEDRTKFYIEVLKGMIPHLLALDSAIDYVRVLMTDGLGREDVVTDSSLIVSMKWMLLIKFVQDLAKDFSIDFPLLEERLADLYKAELSRSIAYNDPNIVGIVRSLGISAGKSKKTP